jgi:hypothetical protein
MNEADQLARQRLLVMNAVRLSGVGLALLGLAIIAGKIDLGREIGAFLFIFGLFEALFMPMVLAKRWKSPPR